MDNVKVTRRELYDLTWSNSMVALSKLYAISDNGLRKICKRMNIPLPGNGHWVKLQFGKKVKIISLPKDYQVEQTITLPLRSDDTVDQVNPFKKLLAEIKADSRLSFDVPERLQTKDPLILAAKARLTGKEPRHSFIYQNTVECSRGELDIRVAPKFAGRALRFMDTLLRLLRGRGHNIILKYDSIRAVVKGQELKMKFREKMKRVIVNDRSWGNTELHPTGVLSFSVEGYGGKEWKDGKRQLESYLPEILTWMELKADRDNVKDEYYRKQREERERLLKIEQELKERKAKDLVDFKVMLEMAERWHKAENLRNYIDEVEKKAVKPAEWVEWAKRKADWYDPFIAGPGELLEDVNPATLTLAITK